MNVPRGGGVCAILNAAGSAPDAARPMAAAIRDDALQKGWGQG